LKLLLDTHVWFWSQAFPDRLTPKIERVLASDAHERWLSPVSVWELVLLADVRRVQLRPDPIQWVRRTLERWPLREAVLSHEIALESRRTNLAHDDPADRFLVATAKVLDLTLVTADERLLESREVECLSAR
jgi:PIN domain nuclease of toxin-antitoxin system